MAVDLGTGSARSWIAGERFSVPRNNGMYFRTIGATRRDRTGDLLITNQPLYQLS